MDGLVEIVIVASMFALCIYRYRQATEGGEAVNRLEEELAQADVWYLSEED